MSKTVYQVVEYDRNNNPVILASGLTKEIAEYALDCDDIKYKLVRWSSHPTYNQQADAEVYRGVLVR